MSQGPLSRDPLFRHSRAILVAGGFRSVRLNAAGWAAIVGGGLIAGGLVALLSPLHPAITLPAGAVAMWVFLLGVDHARERNLITVVGSDDLDAELGAAIVSTLELRGVTASYREDVFDDEDEEDEGGEWVQRGIACRNADGGTVREVIEQVVAERRC